MIRAIAHSQECSIKEARESLTEEIFYLRTLRKKQDLRYTDLQDVCGGLGIDDDYIPHLIEMI